MRSGHWRIVKKTSSWVKSSIWARRRFPYTSFGVVGPVGRIVLGQPVEDCKSPEPDHICRGMRE